MTNPNTGLESLQANPMSVVSTPSAEIVALLQASPQLKGINIGALSSLGGFSDAAHVIYLIKERGRNSRNEPVGDCICMIIASSGSVGLEMSKSLDEFWNYWDRQGNVTFSDITDIIGEMSYFFEHQAPKEEHLCVFRDGGDNARMHRAMRSMQKAGQLKAVFGYDILASEF